MVDYTKEILESGDWGRGVIACHGKDKNVLILRKLEEPIQRFDGKRVSYHLEYNWLSTSCQSEDDEAYRCVKGSEDTYWSKKELMKEGVLEKSGKPKEDLNLFDCFRLFP